MNTAHTSGPWGSNVQNWSVMGGDQIGFWPDAAGLVSTKCGWALDLFVSSRQASRGPEFPPTVSLGFMVTPQFPMTFWWSQVPPHNYLFKPRELRLQKKHEAP